MDIVSAREDTEQGAPETAGRPVPVYTSMVNRRRTLALIRMQELMARMQAVPGEESTQRAILVQLGVSAYEAGVAVGDWLRAYYQQQFCGTGQPECPRPPAAAMPGGTALTCAVCGQQFASKPALNGHQKKHRYG